MSVEGPISINVAQVLADRLGRKARWLPGFLVRALERLICQQEMNELLAGAYPRRGAAFCEYVLEHLGVELEVRGAENLPSSGRCIVHGSQSRAASASLDDALSGGDPVVIYPAGLVSRLGKGGVVADLEWRKMFVNKAVESHRDIVPVFFDGLNSPSFYRLARLRKRLGIKFNIEMVLLPREIFRARGKRFVLTCGKPVPWQTLAGGASASGEARRLREIVYSLNPQNKL